MSGYDDYDWASSVNKDIAPPWVPGNAQSMAAVEAWNAKNYPVTRDNIEQTRIPPPAPGPGVPADFTGGKGALDPAALTVMVQGNQGRVPPYSLPARRDEISRILTDRATPPAAQQQSQQAQNPAPYGYAPNGMPYDNPYGAYGLGSGQVAGAGDMTTPRYLQNR